MLAPDTLVTAAPQRGAAAARDAVLDADERHQYLTFLLGEEMFAIGILAIREIIEYGELTEVPMTPPFIQPKAGVAGRSDRRLSMEAIRNRMAWSVNAMENGSPAKPPSAWVAMTPMLARLMPPPMAGHRQANRNPRQTPHKP